MSIHVCDAICGSGKSSAAINMMNANAENKFIFVTQYLDEVDRIISACKERRFVAPKVTISTGFSKLADIHELIKRGENIATTHALFVSYTDEIKEAIARNKYILILDEVVDVVAISRLTSCDVEILKRSSVISDGEDSVVEWCYEEYEHEPKGLFRDEMLLAKSKNFMTRNGAYFFWAIPPDLFASFSDVYVLTYLFVAQPLKCFFDIHGLSYDYIGVGKYDGEYKFCDASLMNRKRDLRPLVHILYDEKANSIGSERTALSHTWYQTCARKDGVKELAELKKNINNVLRHKFHGTANEIMWTAFKSFEPTLKAKGFWNAFVAFNMRASNNYANRRYLAYCVNNFTRPWESAYYRSAGSELNEDMYALSIIVQWLFRSAIRKGEEVWIYIPSARMRYILNAWLENLAEGRDLDEVEYPKAVYQPVEKKQKQRFATVKPLGDKKRKEAV